LPFPTLFFTFILATLTGAVFHVIFGGGGRRLLLYLFMAWIGFAIGQGVGTALDSDIFNIGTLRAASAVIGGLVALIVTRFLSGVPRVEGRP
jgi:uncharacterized membrane protein YjjP (DUF1212 family)